MPEPDKEVGLRPPIPETREAQTVSSQPRACVRSPRSGKARLQVGGSITALWEWQWAWALVLGLAGRNTRAWLGKSRGLGAHSCEVSDTSLLTCRD